MQKITPQKGKLIALHKEEAFKTDSGIYLSDTNKPMTAEVIAVGENDYDIKVGTTIVFKTYTAVEFRLNTQTYLILEYEDIMATLD